MPLSRNTDNASKNHCWTIHEDVDGNTGFDSVLVQHLLELVNQGFCEYIVFQLENNRDEDGAQDEDDEGGPIGNGFHLQGFLSLGKKPKKRWSQVKRWLQPDDDPGSAHVEVMHGNLRQAIGYCNDPTKASFVAGPWAAGTAPGGQGERSDLHRMCVLAKDPSVDMRDVAGEALTSFARYHGGIGAIRGLYLPARDPARYMDCELIIYWGKTGTGKTRRVFQECSSRDLRLYVKPANKWWDGYAGQEAVLIDDFNGVGAKDLDITEYLRLFSWAPITGEVKGATVNVCALVFYVTSNIDPQYWFATADSGNREAFQRRITKCVEMV